MVLLVDLPAEASFNATAGRLWLGRLALLVVRLFLVVCRLVVLFGVVVVCLVVAVVRRAVVEGTLVDDGVINRCGSVVDRPILFTTGFLVARTAEARIPCGLLDCVVGEGPVGGILEAPRDLLSLVAGCTGLLPKDPCRPVTDCLNPGKVPLELCRDVPGDWVLVLRSG